MRLYLHDDHESVRFRTALVLTPGQKVYPDQDWRKARLDKSQLAGEIRRQIEDETFAYESLTQPELFPVYQEHLQHLGLIEYHNKRARHYKQLELNTRDDKDLTVFSMKLTHFGRLFLKACSKNTEPI